MDSGRRSPAFHVAGFVLLGATAATALAGTWGRWIDEPLIDFGRDLFVPEALASGARLYRDVLYFSPPLAPELLATVVRIFGSSFATQAGIGIAQGLGAAVLLFLLGRSAAGPVGGFAASFLFLALHLTGASTWGCNWIVPYASASTLGMVLLLAGELLFFERALRGGGDRPFVWGSLALLLSGFCKLEFLVAALVLIPLFAVVHRVRWRAAGAVAGLAAVLALTAVVRYGAAPLWDAVFPGALLRGDASSTFYRLVMGTANPGASLGRAAVGAALFVVFAALVVSASRCGGALRILSLFLLASAGAALYFTGDGVFRAFSLLLPVVGVVAAVREPRGPIALLAAFAALSLVRTPLLVSPVWYGFVYLVPLYPFLMRLVFVELPRIARIPPRASLLFLPLLLALGVRDLAFQHRHAALKTVALETRRGVLRDANADRSAVLGDLLARLDETRPRTLLVLPEGVILNWLSGIPLSAPPYVFTAAELSAEAESRYLRLLSQSPPEAVALWPRDQRELGGARLGVDHGTRLVAFVRERYDVDAAFERPGFRVLLLKRRELIESRTGP